MHYRFDRSFDHKGKQKHDHLLDRFDTGEYKKLSGTSSIVDVLNKPLAWWASGEACKMLGWIHPDIKKAGRVIGHVPLEVRLAAVEEMLNLIKLMTPQEFLNLLDQAYRAHDNKLKSSAIAGTDLHAELEKFVKSEMGIWNFKIEQLSPRIYPFVEWARFAVKTYLWSEAHCFDEDMWVGGISDVGVILNEHTVETSDGQVVVPDDTQAVVDFKSSKEAYISQFIQGGGYAEQILKNGLFDAEGKPIGPKITKPFDAIITVPFGAEIVYPEIRMNAPAYQAGFKHSLELYRLMGKDKSEYRL